LAPWSPLPSGWAPSSGGAAGGPRRGDLPPCQGARRAVNKRIGSAFLVGSAAAALVVGWLFGRDLSLAGGEPHPAIDVDRHIELGDCEMLATAEPSVVVRNRGRQPLVLDTITTSCGCLGLFARHGAGDPTKVETLEIGPGGRATLILRLMVSGTPGVRSLQRVRFRTNDPRNPAVEIIVSATPLGGYAAAPASISLGTMPVGGRIERDVEVRAFDRRLPAITGAVSSNEHIRVTFQPVRSAAEGKREAKDGEVVGRLRVSANAPTTPGDIEGAISVSCEARPEPVLVIPVTGRVAHLVELLPSEVRLPRVSSSGPVYTASCICRAAAPKSLALRVQKSPPDLKIQIQDVPDNPSLKIVRIDGAGLEKKVPAAGLVRRVALTAEIDGRRIPLNLTLRVQRR